MGNNGEKCMTCAKSNYDRLRIDEALALTTTTTRTFVSIWDPFPGPKMTKNAQKYSINLLNRSTFEFTIVTSLVCTLFWLIWMNSCAVEQWTFSFLEVVRRHILGEVVNLLLQFIQEYNCERIIEIGPHLRELWGIKCVPDLLWDTSTRRLQAICASLSMGESWSQ